MLFVQRETFPSLYQLSNTYHMLKHKNKIKCKTNMQFESHMKRNMYHTFDMFVYKYLCIEGLTVVHMERRPKLKMRTYIF